MANQQSSKPAGSGRLPWPLLVSLIVFVILLLVPVTGWLVKDQTVHLATPPRELASLLTDLGVRDDYLNSLAKDCRPAEPLRKYSEGHPEDFEIRLAFAIRESGPNALERLRWLRS